MNDHLVSTPILLVILDSQSRIVRTCLSVTFDNMLVDVYASDHYLVIVVVPHVRNRITRASQPASTKLSLVSPWTW